jgi:UDP:flavonoid glycosyltransferase YjiC (YdhE family)
MVQELGHLNATFALARALQARGHDVRYLAYEDREEQVRAQGFEPVLFQSRFFPRGFQAAMDAWEQEPRGLKWVLQGRRHLARFREALEDLAGGEVDRLLAEQRPDLLLVDTLNPVIAVVAHQAGVPVAMLGTTLPLGKMPGVPPICSTLRPGAVSQLRMDLAWGRVLLEQELTRRVLVPLGLGFDSEGILLREARRRGFPREKLHRVSFPTASLELPELVLCPRAFDYPQAEVRPLRHYVGPGVDLERREPDFPWERLAADKPLVYCSLGSSPERWPHFEKFLSSVLYGMSAHPEWQWVLSTGPVVQARVAGLAPAGAVVVPYAPQLALLSRAAVMVGHGGLNSLKEALLHGVPGVVLPGMYDQLGNTARVAYHGLGVVEDISRLTGQKLARAISTVLQEPEYRSRAEAMGRVFQEGNRSDEAVRVVESLLRPPTSVSAAS